MAAPGFDKDNLEISEESFSSLFEEINNYTPKSPLNREPSARAASMSSQGRSVPSKVNRSTGSTVSSGQSPRTAARPVNRVPTQGNQVLHGSENRQQWQTGTPTAQPGLRSSGYPKQPEPDRRRKKTGLLKLLIWLVIILAVFRACGIIGPKKDTKTAKVEEPAPVEEVVEVPEEEVVDLVFASKYLIKHGPAEQLERLSFRLDCESFTRTDDGKLTITTKQNELHEKIIDYLRYELPSVSRADYPNFVEITSNDDFTEFVFTVAAANLYQHEENYMKDVLMIAQMNAELDGNPNEVITIIFQNMNGKVLREKDTKISG